MPDLPIPWESLTPLLVIMLAFLWQQFYSTPRKEALDRAMVIEMAASFKESLDGLSTAYAARNETHVQNVQCLVARDEERAERLYDALAKLTEAIHDQTAEMHRLEILPYRSDAQQVKPRA